MRARALVLALVLVLSGAGGAHAQQRGMPPAEKDEARKLYTATGELHVAIRNLASAVRVSTGTSARAALSTVWSGVVFHAREAGFGSFALLGISTAGATFNEFEAREALSRATWVADSFTHQQNVLDNVSTTTAQVNAAIGVGGQPLAYTTALQAINANLAAAQTNLQSFNRTFSYGQARNLPFCRDAATAQGSIYDTKAGSCNVFGPHGNWPMATWFLEQGWQHLIAVLMDNLRRVYTANDGAEGTMPDSTNAAVADMLDNIAVIADNIMVVSFNFAAIAVTPTQCTFTPLRLVMRTIERILQFGDASNSTTTPAEGGPIAGNPFFWSMRGNMASILDAFIPALSGPPAGTTAKPITHGLLNTVLSDFLLAWRFSEGGFWLAFEMPSDLRNVIIGGTSGPPYAPVAGTTDFPYYFPIKRASDLRIYVRQAGGSTDRTPLVAGANTVAWPGGVTSATVTIGGLNSPTGGTVTITPAPPTDYHVEIERVAGTRLEELRRQPYPENDPSVGTVGPCS